MTGQADRLRPRWVDGSNESVSTPGGSQSAYRVIVHAAGQLDDDETAGFWTEVPALAACASDGRTLDEAIASTRTAIADWLARLGGDPSPGDVQLRVDLAY